jgi:hypothetical protein
MLYHPNHAIKGNMRISANGLSVLMQKDTMNQKLMQFISYIINPVIVQNPNAIKLLRMIGDNMGMKNVDDVLPTEDQMRQFAMMQQAQAMQQIQGVSAPEQQARPQGAAA